MIRLLIPCLFLLLSATLQAARPTPLRVVVAGDLAECKDQPAAQSPAARTAALAARLLGKGGAILLPGDITYPVGAAAEYPACWQPTWGALSARVIPAPGNHDYATAEAAAYFDFFGANAGPDRRGYYSLDLGSWHIVSLNSQLQATAATAQLEWLRADLARARGKHACLLALWHYPVFSSGLHGNNPTMRPALAMLQDAGADLILNGHDHHYERFGHLAADGSVNPRAPRQFVVGTGGAGLYPLSTRQPGSEAAITHEHGVLLLTLGASDYSWAFHGLGSTSPLDSGKDPCLSKP